MNESQQSPGTPTAAPCLRCKRTDGYIQRGCSRPWRARGLCKYCYNLDYLPDYHAGRVGSPKDACLSCGDGLGTTRGLCRPCYTRAKHIGILLNYPSCGPRPVPYSDYHMLLLDARPTPIPANLSPILRPDPAQPVWTGLARAKYSAPTWHTLRSTPPDGWRFAATDDAARAA